MKNKEAILAVVRDGFEVTNTGSTPIKKITFEYGVFTISKHIGFDDFENFKETRSEEVALHYFLNK